MDEVRKKKYPFFGELLGFLILRIPLAMTDIVARCQTNLAVSEQFHYSSFIGRETSDFANDRTNKLVLLSEDSLSMTGLDPLR